MARVDKQIISARRFALLVLTIAFTSVFLVTGQVQTWRKISKARELMAYWLAFDYLKVNLEILHSFGSVRQAPSSLTQLLAERNEGMYSVYPREDDHSFYNVSFKVSSEVGDSEELYDQLRGLRPWRREVYSRLFKEVDRELTEAEAQDITRARRLFRPSADRNGDSWHRYLRHDPRWSRLVYVGMETVEKKFEMLTNVARGDSGRIDIEGEYFKFERSAARSEFKVPLLDVMMSTDLALWSLIGLLLLQCILLFDAVSGMCRGVMQRDEPWLLLDYNRGSAAVVARAWLILILLAPILTAAAHLTYLWVRYSSGEGSLRNLVFTGIFLAALATFGTSFTWRTVRSLRQYRELIGDAERLQVAVSGEEEPSKSG